MVGCDPRYEAGFLLARIITQQLQGNSVLAQQSLRTSAAVLFFKGSLCRPTEVTGRELLVLKGRRSHGLTRSSPKLIVSVKMLLKSEIKILATTAP